MTPGVTLQAAKQDIENIKGINTQAVLIYRMEAYWPVFLLMGVRLKLSQSGLSLAGRP